MVTKVPKAVFKYKLGDKSHGIIKHPKPDIDFEAYIKRHAEKGIGVLPVKEPSMKQLERWACDSIVESVDGCEVEPDGHCEHGFPSWMLVIGVI